MQNTADETETRSNEGPDAETRFRTELFGFDRVEVLSYIEKISAANAEKARALEQTITQLQQGISVTRQREDAIKQKARQVLELLENQKKRAEDAVAEAAELRTQVDRANDQIAAVQSRLFAKEQENEALKIENAEFSATIDSLTRSLNETSNADAFDAQLRRRSKEKADEIVRKADAQAEAEVERAKEHADRIMAHAAVEKNRVCNQVTQSADGIAASISVLKSQLTAVDAKILAATSDLQRATEGIVAALTNTERSLASLRQPAAAVSGVSGGYPSSADPWNPSAYAAVPHNGYDVHRSTVDEEYQRALYEIRQERAAREEYERREQERIEYERREREKQERERREQERLEQERSERERREEQKKSRLNAYAQPLWHTAHTEEKKNPNPQPEKEDRPMRNRVDYTLKKAEITGQEQYDAVQNASRGVQMPYDLPTGFEPHQITMTKPSYPQVEPQRTNDDPHAFGKPHAPRAMPFTAFDPYTPHTAPYVDPNAEEARILNAPPAPPAKKTREKVPYVPQPTPITGSAPLERVQVPQFGAEGAPMQEYTDNIHNIQNAYPVKDTPVIIPYSAPIPAFRNGKKESKEAPNPIKTKPSPKETQDELLENLRAMLEE